MMERQMKNSHLFIGIPLSWNSIIFGSYCTSKSRSYRLSRASDEPICREYPTPRKEGPPTRVSFKNEVEFKYFWI